MPFGLPWSRKFIGQIADKEDRDEFVADQVRVRIAISIRTLREQRGMSQAAFGKLLGKPQSVVSRLEDPDYGKVSLQTLLDVASALDIPLLVEFPEWEDWFRRISRLKKNELERREFDGVFQTDQAVNNTSVLQFSAGSRNEPITATVTGDNDDVVPIKGRVYA
jgi:transcriptional regulator with XRE-family HTH domain